MRAINVLKYLCHPTTGCNRKTLFPVYKLLIQSIIYYGSPIYNLAPPSQLKLLDSVQNSSLRILTGAFQLMRRNVHSSSPLSPFITLAKLLSTSSLYQALTFYNWLFHEIDLRAMYEARLKSVPDDVEKIQITTSNFGPKFVS